MRAGGATAAASAGEQLMAVSLLSTNPLTFSLCSYVKKMVDGVPQRYARDVW